MSPYLGQIVAVEAVVEPGYKGSHSEEGDTTVVELGEQFADEPVLMAADGVICEGEAQADDGSGEESHEDRLLLVINLH